MPPAEPAKKDARKKGERNKRGKDAPKQVVRKKTALCHTCGSRIRIPDGWTVGPAVRRHYWAKHRTTMQPRSGR